MTGPLADAAARRRIREDLDTSFFVEAAAGTGKTTALVGRIVSVLREGRTTLDRVVAVTFTEKAAGEMKLRLRTAIEAALAAARGAEAGRLEDALERLEVANLTTIHGFCQELLQERPLEAGVDPRFRVAADAEAERLLDRAFEAWFQETLEDPPEGVRRVLRRSARRGRGGWSPREQLRSALTTLVEHRDFDAPWARPEGFDREAALDGCVERLRELAALAGRARKSGDYLKRNLDAVGRFLAELDRREEVHPRDPDLLEVRLEELVRWRRNGWHYRGYGSEYGEGLPRAEVIARRDRTKEHVEGVLETCGADLAARLREELRPAVRRYEALKRREGRLDFVDLLLRTRDLLRDHDGIRRHYQGRFTHFFVDELQDTDPLQAEILLLLCADDPDERDFRRARPVPGKLFAVGDPKQSIYRFRRADVRLYEETKRRLAGNGAEVLRLTTSFRGVPGLQSAVNGAFPLRMTASEDGSQAGYVPLERHRPAHAGQPAVVALPVPEPYGQWGIWKKRIDESFPDAVAAFVDWLVNESEWKVTERDRPRRPVDVEARHVCLLFRRFQSWGGDVTRPYVRALEAREIPHVLVGGRSFFDREEVLALRNALTAIEWPDDALSVYAALRGPLFSLTDEALLAFRHRSGALHPLRPWGDGDGPGDLHEEDRAVGEALAALGRLHRARNHRPIAETALELLAEVRAHAGIAIWPTGEQALANCLRIVDRAREFEREGAASFRAFVERLDEEAERGQAEEAPIVEEGTEGVRMMTVHKAKGLEFPVVILADPSCNAAPLTPSRHVDPGAGLWAERICGATPLDVLAHREAERSREAHEAVRLCYVAATRARDLLVVPALGDGRDGKGGVPGLAAALAPGADGEGGAAGEPDKADDPWADERDWWLDALNPALYPPPEARRDPAPADGCPGLGEDSVLSRQRPDAPIPSRSVAPGRHVAAAGNEVVWWDPRALELDREAPTGRRQRKLLEADEAGARAREGIAAHEAWARRRAERLERGARPSLRVRTATDAAAETAAGPDPAGADPAGPDASRPEAEGADVRVVEVERPAGESRPGGRRFGELVHRALAAVDLAAAERDSGRGGAGGGAGHGGRGRAGEGVEAVVRSEARVLGAPEEEVGPALRVVRRALAHPLLSRAAAAARRGDVRRETPVFLARDGEVLEGVVDLAFREAADSGPAPGPARRPEAGADAGAGNPTAAGGGRPVWTVVDFKTDREVAGARAVYEAQLGAYVRAVEAATGEPARGVLLIL